jgi:hypothetical protein
VSQLLCRRLQENLCYSRNAASQIHLMAQKLISCGTILDCPDLKYDLEESVHSNMRLGEQG